MGSKKKAVLQLIISIAGVFAAVYGVMVFNNHLLLTLPLAARMVLMPALQWLLFLVPAVLMLINKEKLSGLGFSKTGIVRQGLTGLVLALFLSGILTVVPILLGFRDFVGSTSYTQPWQFVYQFVYMLFGVALAEELIFRGYIFHKLLEIKNNHWLAAVVSSMLFGLFHIFSGNWIQVLLTAVLGFIYCVCREKIKGCSILSLIIAHGVYDALITVWLVVLQ